MYFAHPGLVISLHFPRLTPWALFFAPLRG